MKKTTLAVLALAAALAIGFFFKDRFFEKASSASSAPPTAPGAGPKQPDAAIEGYIARSVDLAEALVVSGTLRPAEEVEIRPEISGRMVKMNLVEGKTVSKGDLLVKIFDGDLQASLQKLQQQKSIAEKTLDRLQKLLAANGTGQQEVDNAQNQLNNIAADIELTNAQLTKTEIRAPFSGRLGLRNVSPGAYVQPSMSLASLYQTSPLKLDFFVPEKHAASLREGSSIRFSVDGAQGLFMAKVSVIEPKIDESTRSVKIRAIVQGASSALRAGAFAKIDLALAQGRGIVVPSQAIIPSARDKKAIVVRDGKAQMVVVTVGQRTEGMVEISEGLSVGDTVVTTGLLFVRPGQGLKFKSIAN